MELNIYGDVIIHPTYSESEGSKGNERKTKTIRGSSSLNTFKKRIRGRDIKCQCCGEDSKHLEVHHILPLSEYKDLACDDGNAVGLCQSCHRKYHQEYKGEVNAVTFGEFLRRFGKRVL